MTDEYKWICQLTQIKPGVYAEIVKTYGPDEIIVHYDRIYDEYWTLSGTVLDKSLRPIKDSTDK